MTTRVLITGSSHVAALKLGWDQISTEFPDIECIFLAISGPQLWRFSTNEKNEFGIFDFTDMSSTLRDHFASIESSVDLNTIDTVLVSGSKWEFQAVLRALTKCDVDGLFTTDRDVPSISLPMFEAFCAEVAERAYRSNDYWAKHFQNVPLSFIPQPRLSEASLNNEDQWHKLKSYTANTAKALSALEKKYLDVVRAHDIRIFPQPSSTIADNGFTKAEYSRNSVRLVGGDQHPEQDTAHMNQDYGEIVLREILPKMVSELARLS
ncbi:hypothetical protein [Shimia sp. Alg240-R146]|uniref:hypothetical protein n=1 Tax=Shimia sp. Alg240-R146 TaxID=2993449 RepID=UPI0022E607E4|nr:hypothetical protein [Shimia sp. Alg240-R146]